jgi:hypothetical protein
VLIDSVIFYELLRGAPLRWPFPPDRSVSFRITYPEYLIALSTAAHRRPPAIFRAIDELAGRSASGMTAATALMDLNSLREYRGLNIDLAIPRAECIPQVIEFMISYDLFMNEATNLVFAESEAALFCGDLHSMRRQVRKVLESRNIEHFVADTD